MSLAALVRNLAAAGASPEAIALAVEAVEGAGALLDARRAADRERKARERARRRQQSELDWDADAAAVDAAATEPDLSRDPSADESPAPPAPSSSLPPQTP